MHSLKQLLLIRHITFLLLGVIWQQTLLSQNPYNYTNTYFVKRFETVDSLTNLAQYESAFKEVKAIKTIADDINHDGYKVKCFRMMIDLKSSYYTESTEMHEFVSGLFKEEFNRIALSEFENDYKAFLLLEHASYLSKLYISKSKDELAYDTAVFEFKWSKDELKSHALSNIREALLLCPEKTNLSNYMPAFIGYTGMDDYQANLKCLMALEGIEILKPMRKFYDGESFMIDTGMFDEPILKFMQHDFGSEIKDQIDGLILSLYQEVLKNYHVYFDLERLDFMHQLMPSSTAYFRALKSMYQRTPETPYLNLVALEMADELSENHPKEALLILNEALNKRPDFKQNSKLLHARYEIEQPYISGQFESLYSPNQSPLFAVDYKNVDTAYVRIYKVNYVDHYNQTQDVIYSYQKDTKIQLYVKTLGTPLHSLKYDLTPFGDMKSHSEELKLPRLKAGVYMVSLANRANWDDTLLTYKTTIFTVNDNIFIELNKDLYLQDANNGQPKAGVKLKQYKYIKDKFVYQSEVVTDANGRVPNADKNEQSYKRYMYETNDGNLAYFYSTYYNYNQKESSRTIIRIITDRAIYRPGQKVKYKCIAYNNLQNKTVPKLSISVVLNKDGELVRKNVHVTNSYGSSSGEFQLPIEGSGVYSIIVKGKNAYGSGSIRVEEYKLSKFAAEILPLDSAYKLGDKILVKGKAMALAGYPVSGAKVMYTVSRRIQIQLRYDYYKFSHALHPEQLYSGEVNTNNEGLFNIEFLASKSNQVKENVLYSVFSVEGTVTDLNGEVRQFSKEIILYETDRIAELQVEEQHLNNKDLQIQYHVKTTDGVNLSFSGKISVYRVDDISELKKSRYWKVDTSRIKGDDAAIVDYLPKYYSPIRTLVKVQNFTNDTGHTLTINKDEIQIPGPYLAVLESKDSKGNSVKFEASWIVNEAVLLQCFQQKVVQVYSLNGNRFQPGQTAKVAIASGLKDQNVLVNIQSKRGVLMNKFIRLNQSITVIDLPIVAQDRGNIIVYVYAVSHYRSYQGNLVINVPYSNKELAIKVKTLRNNIEPGSREKWVFTLSGPASEKAATEILARMYDASLDEIQQADDWQFGLYNEFYVNFNPTPVNYVSSMNSWINIASKGYSYWSFNYPKMGLSYRYIFDQYRSYWGFGSGMAKSEANYNFAVYDKRGFEFKEKEVYEAYDSVGVTLDANQSNGSTGAAVLRKNFNETAFFLPHLYTNANGDIQIEFTMPDALSKWRLSLMAHSTTMQLGKYEAFVTSSKKLMVQPNMPRFLRQNERITIASKIVNTTNETIESDVSISLKEVKTGKALNWSGSTQHIRLDKKAVVPVSFSLQIPNYTGLVQITITATSKDLADAEEHTLLVLSNRTLVQTSLPITIRKAGKQNLEFTSLLKSRSTSLVHQSLTAEMYNNPAWSAVMSMPYMMEYPNECAEQLFTRLYGNLLSLHLVNKNPEIKMVVGQWLKVAADKKNPINPLNKNEDLKTAALTETPWLMEASNETERLQKLGELFESGRMQKSVKNTVKKLEEMQLSDGGFPWFSGMQSNYYITQTIVIGFGKLKSMGVDVSAYQTMIEKAINFLDKKTKDDCDYFTKDSSLNFDPVYINYLYAKMAFPGIGYAFNHQVINYFAGNAEKSWSKMSLLNRAQMAVILKAIRPESKIPDLIIKSFDDVAIRSEEMGMYWLQNKGGWYWYESPVETQVAIIEAYNKVKNDQQAIKEQQIWLLRQKQTQSWASTKSTADACYALLNYNHLLQSKQSTELQLGKKKIEVTNQQSGTGYYIQKIPASEINNDMGTVTVNATTSDFAYGAIHWQYFEDQDKVQKQGNGLSIHKTILVNRIENGIPVKKRLNDKDTLLIGDVIEVVLAISTDRDLEFVHVKDQRASGTEPMDVKSEYQWSNGLWYYQVTRDVSSNFFIDNLSKGSYQLSYQLTVQQAGHYSTGVATAQCMYAPEYIANSQSVVLKAK